MRVLDMILAGLKFIEFISFVDDLIIFSNTYEEHTRGVYTASIEFWIYWDKMDALSS